MTGTGITTRFALPAAFAALLAYTVPAVALDTDAFLDRLQAVMAEQGTNVGWAEIDQYENDDGDPVIGLIDVNVEVNGEGTTLPLVELIDVTEQGGGWRVGTLLVPEFSNQDGDSAVYLSEIAVDGMLLEPEGQENAYGGALFYEAARLAEMAVTVKGVDVFTMTDMAIEVDLPEGGEPMVFTGAAEAFTAKPGAADDPKTRATAAALGYSDISGSFAIDGDWDPASGLLRLTRYDITVDDAGTIGISLEIGGYTPDFIKSLRETQAAMLANPNGDQSASGMAMLGLMQQLSFHSARIHFDDDTLTNKVLEFAAQQQGGRARDVANQAKAMVPFMMMQIGDQQLTAQATTAVSAFLDNPGNLVVSAAPPAPVPFALLMAGAMSAPQTLPQTLGVTITANE
ncbi:MAG: hypothetical protein JJ911_07360 [Rhizobiaceae bacterium]|nr:hypothetical protein [Rhizobiaceae bacterium]